MMNVAANSKQTVTTLTYVLFFGPNGQPPHVYAILARDFDPKIDKCCTRFHLDGTLRVYPFQEIDKAISRLNNKDLLCPLRQNIPTHELNDILQDRLLRSPPLMDEIVQLKNNLFWIWRQQNN